MYMTHVGIFPELHSFLCAAMRYLPSPSGRQYVAKFAETQVQDRLKADMEKHGGTSDDFLGKVVKMHTENLQSFPFRTIFGTCLTNIGAGSDTTSVSLSSILLGLIKQPEALRKVIQVFNESNVGTCSAHDVY